MGVCSGRLKKGGGVLGAGPNSKKGGLRCRSGKKGGVFTAAHTYTKHICEYHPLGAKLVEYSFPLAP